MKILAADGIAKKGIELLQKDVEVDVKDKLPAEELLEIIPQYDAIIGEGGESEDNRSRWRWS